VANAHTGNQEALGPVPGASPLVGDTTAVVCRRASQPGKPAVPRESNIGWLEI